MVNMGLFGGRRCLQVLAGDITGQVGEEGWVFVRICSPREVVLFSSSSFRILGLTLRSFIYFI